MEEKVLSNKKNGMAVLLGTIVLHLISVALFVFGAVGLENG